jgi:hypothetical protein
MQRCAAAAAAAALDGGSRRHRRKRCVAERCRKWFGGATDTTAGDGLRMLPLASIPSCPAVAAAASVRNKNTIMKRSAANATLPSLPPAAPSERPSVMAGVALHDSSGSTYQVSPPQNLGNEIEPKSCDTLQIFANDAVAPYRPQAFHSNWHTCERRGKEHSLPSHGGHIDGLLAHGVMKEHGDRR